MTKKNKIDPLSRIKNIINKYIEHVKKNGGGLSGIKGWKVFVEKNIPIFVVQIQVEEADALYQVPLRFLFFNQTGQFIFELEADECGWPGRYFPDDCNYAEITIQNKPLDEEFQSASYLLDLDSRS